MENQGLPGKRAALFRNRNDRENIMAIKWNFHTHTTFCDGKSTAEEMVQRALELGFDRLGFSGHCYTWFDPEFHMDTEAYFAELHRLQEAYRGRLEIFCGLEGETLGHGEGYEKAEYIIGSTHYLKTGEEYLSFDNTEEELTRMCREYFGGDYYRLCRAYFETTAKTIDSIRENLKRQQESSLTFPKNVTSPKNGKGAAAEGPGAGAPEKRSAPLMFAGHFDLVTRFNDAMHFVDEEDPRYLGPAMEAMEYLVGEGVPFEINLGALNRGRKKYAYPAPTLLRKLHELGGEILISSDAHHRDLLDGGFAEGIAAAEAAGFDHALVMRRNADGSVEWEEAAPGLDSP